MFEVATVTSVTNSLHTIFDRYDEIKNSMEEIADFVGDANDAIGYFVEGNTSSISSYDARNLFNIENALKALDADFWSRVINMTNVLEFMPEKKRDQWNESIREKTTPSFEKQTVINTVQDLLSSRESFLAEKIEGLFLALSPNHKTNSPMAFMDRMILENIVDKMGLSNHNKFGYIHDLRTSIAKIQKRDEPKRHQTDADLHSILRDKDYGTWLDFDGGNFKIRLYKKGTAHIEIHPDVADELNRLLAMRNPTYIPSKEMSQNLKFRRKEVPLRQVVISQTVLETIRAIADKWDNGRDGYHVNLYPYSKEQKEEFWDVISAIGGTKEEHGTRSFKVCFDFDPVKALQYISRVGSIPDKKSYQFYPTSEELVEEMQYKIRKLPRYHREILEPSAGTGNLITGLSDYGCTITCIEIDPLRCEVLKAKAKEESEEGIKTIICGDFLEWASTKKFNGVIMNPPFTKNQAENHVKKAWNHVAPGGILVACLPASLKGKEIIPGHHHEWSVFFEDQFEETKVRVVILTVRNIHEEDVED